MADQRYIDFIENMINKTKEKKIRWYYLDGKQELYEGMGWTKSKKEYELFRGNIEILTPNFNTEESFYASIDDIYIVIYVWKDQPAKLYIVPYTYKKVTTLTPDEYGEYITRLLNLVQSQFPNAETFIDNFLKKESDKKSN